MQPSCGRLTGGKIPTRPWTRAISLLLLPLLAACGGGGGEDSVSQMPPAAVCDPSDSSTFDECGTLFVGLTDADGDFLSYSVDVVSLELEKAGGAVVETLPNSARMDFVEYVDLTEFVSAANVPPGAYVAGRITLDYDDAEVFVEADGDAKSANVVDVDGNPLGRATFEVTLSDRNQLVVTRGRPAILTVDFDLAASHGVDVSVTPALATAEPFLVAEIDPVDAKDVRLRGVLVDVDEAGSSYTVALRPFHRTAGDFGRATVQVTGTTEFEIDAMTYAGADGLAALAAAGPGTLTVMQGSLDVAEREFTADIVLAGTSVPGNGLDAVHGSVVARSGDRLRVRGGTVVLADGLDFFRDDIEVTIGPDTKVFKHGADGMLDTSAISVGQSITIRGEVTANDASGVTMDATAGAARLHVTRLSGVVRAMNPGQLDVELQSLDRRRADAFDFSGTGAGPSLDADPGNYEVATGALPLDAQSADRPVVALGFPSAFGTAPPDFEGRTVIDFGDVRSLLGIGWGADGTTAPFLAMNADGLTLDNGNPAIDGRHFIKQGPVLIDLTSLPSGTRIVPPAEERSLYSIKTGDSLRLYTDFADFVAALTASLDGVTAARSMYARGSYDAEANVFTARKAGIHLLEP